MKKLTRQMKDEKYIFEPIMKQARLAIFASGKGTNAQKIIEYFKGNPGIKICLILTNNPRAGVLEVASKFQIPAVSFTRDEFYNTDLITEKLYNEKVTHVVLAGFLWLVPEKLISRFPDRIVNIHPALLPRFGGKGMYGKHVHEAVKQSGENESGITIHLVNTKYDDGRYLHQQKVNIYENDSVDEIEKKVQRLEHACYAEIIERWIQNDYFATVE